MVAVESAGARFIRIPQSMKTLPSLRLASRLLLLASMSLLAEVSTHKSLAQIASWDFTGLAATATADATASNAQLDSVPVLTRGAGAPASAGANSFRTTGFRNDGISTSNTDYFEFTIRAATGNKASIASISANLNGTSSFSASPGTSNQFAYSLDGSTFTLIGSPTIRTGSGAIGPIDTTAVSELQNVPAGTTVTIRFYASGQTTTGGWGFFSADGLVVDGIVSSDSPDAPVITSPTTASGTAFESFSYQIEASNSPTSFDATGLPDGLSVDTVTGLISGTPTVVGTTNVTIFATNADGTGSEVLALTIAKNPGAPTITSSLSVVGEIGLPFSYQIEASNSPTSFALVGTLPTGLTFDELTGTITGTPETSLSRNVTISATNALGIDSQTLNIFTGSAPALVNPFGAAYAGAAMSIQIVASGPPTSYSAPALPAGLSLDAATGVITGTLASAGANIFEVTVTNPLGSSTADFTLTVFDQAAQDAIPLNVVVNKYLNSAPDRIQLLVVGDGSAESSVDMRGMIVKDFSGNNANDGGGKFIFTDNEVWAAVPAGTLIDLLGPGALFPEEPFIDSDNFYIAARLQDPTAFTSGGGAFDIGANDMVMIKAAGTGVSGVAGGIHVLCAGSAGAQFNAFLGAKLRSTANAAPSAVALNSTSQLSDFGVSGGAAATGVAVTVPAEELDFESWNNATNEIYIKALRGAVDGTGSVVVRNATVGSAFSGRNLFARSSSGQSLAIDYTPTSATTPISALSIDVPVGFGTPQQVNVALAGSGAEDAVVTVVGQVVSIENLTLVNPDTLTVTISGLATPNTAASVTDTGAYEFAMQSQGQDGSLAPLAAPPVARVVIPIANVRNADPETFVPVLFGQTVAVEGVCSVGRLGTGNTNSALQDATHGVTIFSQSAVPGPQTRGNRYAVVGTVSQFNGLVQLNLSDPALVFDLGFVGDPVPVTVSVTEFNTNGLTYQSRVVRIENLSYVSGTWANSTNVILQDGSSNQLTVRIQSGSTANTPPESYPVSVTGIGGQFDDSSPFDGGFRLQPRDAADVTSSASINVTGAAFSAFSATQGAPSLAQTVSVSGSSLTGNLTVTAPAGFEVSPDGVSYASSLALSPVDGSVAATTISVRLTGAAPGSFSGTVSFASEGAATEDRAVSGTVSGGGQAFDAWADGAPLDQANLLKYAIGGASSPTAADGVAPATGITATDLSLTAIVRTNDPNLATVGAAIVNLSGGTWSTDGVTMTPDVNQDDVPEGCERQIFSAPRGVDGKKFLRLQSTLGAQ